MNIRTHRQTGEPSFGDAWLPSKEKMYKFPGTKINFDAFIVVEEREETRNRQIRGDKRQRII